MLNFFPTVQKISLLVIVVLFISCKKEPAIVTKTDLLTANIFIYESFYQNWQQPGQRLAYQRNSPPYIVDYSNETLKFYQNLTFDEITNTGALRNGTWQFAFNETQLTTSGQGYSNTVFIDTLTADRLVWTDNINHSHGIQISKK